MILGKLSCTTLTSTALLSCGLLLSACGGSSTTTASNDAGIKTGVFIDAPVKGLTYKTATQSGTTNEKGEFKYLAGENISFSLDGLELGAAKAQAKLPVTLISTNGYTAQLLQSLDTDANPDLIDVTGIKLEPRDPASRYREYLTTILQYGVMRWASGDFDGKIRLQDYLNLSKIQTDSQITLVNSSVVPEAEAARHVYQAVGSTPWQVSDLAGKVFALADARGNKEITRFNADGTFTLLAQDAGDTAALQGQGTWLLNNGELLITFVAGSSSQQYKIHQLSQDDNTIDFWPEDTSATESNGLSEWHHTKPLTLAALNGKHLSFDMTGNTHCTAMTISFSGTTVIVRDQCDGKFEEVTGRLETEAGVQNLVKA